MKQLMDRFPQQVDEALEQHTHAAERWANYLRLFFAAMYGAAVLRSWDHYSIARPVYLQLAVGWLIVFLMAKTWGRDGAGSKVTVTTLLDFTVVNLGIALFTWRGLYADFNTGLYLSYYPVLAIAASRFRPALVLMSAAWAMLVYAPLSIVAQTPSWARIAIFSVTAALLALASRSPKAQMVKLASDVWREAYDQGAKDRQSELTAH